jgi:NAD(P)H-dependent FMN reductase
VRAANTQTDVKRRSAGLNDRQTTGTKVLGVAGSLRQNSRSTRALKSLLDIATNKYGAQTQILDLRETRLPLYNPTVRPGEPVDNNIQTASRVVKWADALVLASPDYHGSMSGTVKNFLDYFWEEFAGKTFGYLCTSHEKGLTVMDQMRTAVRQCYGWSMPYGISVNGEQDFNAKGEIINVTLSRRLTMLARDLSVYGKLIREQFQKDLEDNDSYTFAARYRG